METKVNYILVGIFVLLFSAAIITGGLWLGTRPLSGNYKMYYTYMTESVSGLNKDASVQFLGVAVGRVIDIRLDPGDPDRVRLLLAIKQNTPITEDTVATLATQGLTGSTHINLTGRNRGAPPLQTRPGQKYPVIKSGPSLFMRLDKGVTHLIASVTTTSESLNAFLEGPSRRNIDKSLAALEKVLQTLAARSGSLNTALKAAAHTLRQSAKASDLVPGLITQLEQTSASLKQMAGEVAHQSDTVGKAAATGAQGVNRLSAEAGYEIRALSANLEQLIHQVEQLTRSLEQNPSILLYGRPAPPPGPGE